MDMNDSTETRRSLLHGVRVAITGGTSGLGLALVKALTALHGGSAVIESKLGEGTTVRLRLPHAAVSETGERLTPEREEPIPLRGAA